MYNNSYTSDLGSRRHASALSRERETGFPAIPKALRDKLGIRPGTALEFSVRERVAAGVRRKGANRSPECPGWFELPREDDESTLTTFINAQPGGAAECEEMITRGALG